MAVRASAPTAIVSIRRRASDASQECHRTQAANLACALPPSGDQPNAAAIGRGEIIVDLPGTNKASNCLAGKEHVVRGHLLTGLLFDDARHRMIPTHATKARI